MYTFPESRSILPDPDLRWSEQNEGRLLNVQKGRRPRDPRPSEDYFVAIQ